MLARLKIARLNHRLDTINRLKLSLKNLATEIKISIRKDIRKKEKTVLDSKNPKIFFAYVNSKLKAKDFCPPLKNAANELLLDPKDKADAFNKAFASVFTVDDGNTVIDPPKSKNVLQDFVFNVPTVYDILRKLKPSLSYGPDIIPNLVLKRCADELSEPLTTLFNYSFQEGVLPCKWLSARVRPLFKKKGDPSSCLNYRPISLTSCVCKSMEKIIKIQLMNHFESNKLLPAEQHGFRKNRSTATQVLNFCNFLTKAIDDKTIKQVDAIYLDFQKAFDKVSHPNLLAKLIALGVQGRCLRWIESFLSNRTQQVEVSGILSDSEKVSSGVPQGTVLAPVLFVAFIHDINEICKFSKIKLFADDVTLFKSISFSNTNVDKINLQSDLDSIAEYANNWQLSLAIDKCQPFICQKPNHSPLFNPR